MPASYALEIDDNGDVVMGTEVVISKRYGYDSEDDDVVAAMVEAYNARAQHAALVKAMEQCENMAHNNLLSTRQEDWVAALRWIELTLRAARAEVQQ